MNTLCSVFSLCLMLVPFQYTFSKDDLTGEQVLLRGDSSKLGRLVDGKVINDGMVLPNHFGFEVDKDHGEYVEISIDEKNGYLLKNDVISLDKAVPFFSDKIKNNPNDPTLYLRRAYGWGHTGNNDMQLKDYDTAISVNPKYAFAYSCRAGYWMARQKYEKSLPDISKAIELDPTYVNYYASRALAYKLLKKKGLAIADYTKGLEVDVSHRGCLYGRGQEYMVSRMYDYAIVDFSKLIGLDPTDDTAIDFRAWCYYAQGEYKKSIADSNSAIKLNPRNARAYHDRGLCFVMLKEYEKAESDFSKAISIKPKYSIAFSGRALMAYCKKEYQTAIDNYSKAIELDSGNIEALTGLSWVLATCPDKQHLNGAKAREYAKTAVRYQPYWRTYAALAVSEAQLGNFELAIEAELKAQEDASMPMADGTKSNSRLENYRKKQPVRENNPFHSILPNTLIPLR